MPPAPRQQEGSGLSNVTASNERTPEGHQAAYDLRDFLRAQIERRWIVDPAAPRGAGDAVSVHIVLNRDGSVVRAEAVTDRRYETDAAYRELALSARNAVLMSSPLTIPPGRYEEVRDITLTLRPRDVLR